MKLLLSCALFAFTAAPSAAPPLAPSVDLRPEFERLHLPPRAQGARPTCSIFTTCAALEFALARVEQRGERMSVEYLNWAANAASGWHDDGDFFHHALAGFVQEGLCSESELPYAEHFDPNATPPAAVCAHAQELKARTLGRMVVHWIVPWTPGHFSLTSAQFDEVRRTLDRGWPVAAGSGHSRLLVGYREDASAPGGGVFLTNDSALAAFGEVSFEFVRKDVADVFWVEAL